jgi:monothiol glutaredoxin
MTTSMADRIKSIIESSNVVLFMKGVPAAPQCGFSATVVKILSEIAVPFKSVDVLSDPYIREGIKEFSSWPTIPQLYVKGEFVGGCDIVREMFQTGELAALLSEKGIVTLAS